jgi:hypothetical protein
MSVWPGYMLKKVIAADSPLLKVIENNLEGNYIVKVKLK